MEESNLHRPRPYGRGTATVRAMLECTVHARSLDMTPCETDRRVDNFQPSEPTRVPGKHGLAHEMVVNKVWATTYKVGKLNCIIADCTRYAREGFRSEIEHLIYVVCLTTQGGLERSVRRSLRPTTTSTTSSSTNSSSSTTGARA